MFPSPWGCGPSALRSQCLGCSQFHDVGCLVLVHSGLDPLASVLWAACWEVPTAGFLTFLIFGPSVVRLLLPASLPAPW